MTDSNSDKVTPQELQLVLQLIQNAKLDGLAEIEYKSLRVKFHAPTRQALAQNPAAPYTVRGNWSTVVASEDK